MHIFERTKRIGHYETFIYRDLMIEDVHGRAYTTIRYVPDAATAAKANDTTRSNLMVNILTKDADMFTIRLERVVSLALAAVAASGT
jgi:hypothetical protein